MARNTIPTLIPTEEGGVSYCSVCECAKACFSNPLQKTENFFCLIRGHGIAIAPTHEPSDEEIREQILREAEENQKTVSLKVKNQER
jgi:hypothetical protein